MREILADAPFLFEKRFHRCRDFRSFLIKSEILIDTAGVNPRDRRDVTQLSALFEGLPQIRRILLCPAATNAADLTDWVVAFEPLHFGSLFFTKLDECRYYGALLNTAVAAGCPLSYFSLGQNMAGDLTVASPEIVASLLLEEADTHA